jgi:hypothetical protein
VWRILFHLLDSRALDEPALLPKIILICDSEEKRNQKSRAARQVAGVRHVGINPRPSDVESQCRAGANQKGQAEWQKYYSHLLELREQLLHQMNGLAKESAQEMPGYSLHMADSGTDNFDRDFALSLLVVGPGRGLRNRGGAQAHREKNLRRLRIDRQNHSARPARGDSVDAVHGGAPRRNWKRKARCDQRRLGALGSVDGRNNGS